ncbi:MAG: PQQ-dependent sugar dehydrogenase, partial [Nitrospirae bacterium]|nr:PQQ-dependent sugar dehydrogenase [Fimbriimonadaceae bacterium]
MNRSLAIALAGASALSSAQLQLTTFASGFSNPIAIIADPDSASRFFVVQQRGLIRMVENGSVLPGNFLDVSTLIATGGERGLLGMAFDPAHATNRYFYLNFTETSTGATRIVRYTRSATTTADAASRFDLLRIPQPFTNHNGGTIAFGDDGFLYIGMGDGGSANDPNNAAQTTSSLLGKMLRIDVNGDDFPTDNARNYRIPPSNPFLDGVPVTASGEIWAFGVRN